MCLPGEHPKTMFCTLPVSAVQAVLVTSWGPGEGGGESRGGVKGGGKGKKTGDLYFQLSFSLK